MEWLNKLKSAFEMLDMATEYSDMPIDVWDQVSKIQDHLENIIKENG